MARFRPNAPPGRQGVSASCVVLPQSSGPPGAVRWGTVADFLAERFPHVGAGAWAERLRQGDVVNASGHALSPQSPFEPGLRIYYFRAVPEEADIPFEHTVLHRDEHLLVVDKPHFLPVVPSGKYVQQTLLARLKSQLGLDNLAPIHRIDRDTAGLVMFSIDPATRNHYHALFRQHQVRKTYAAIAPWNAALSWPPSGVLHRESRIGVSTHFMQQTEVPGEPNAVTDIRLIEVLPPLAGAAPTLARYELRPATGQRHQLRVHMNALGLPILNDGIYPALTPENTADFSKPLQLLAQVLEFIDPVTSLPQKFVSQRRLEGASADQVKWAQQTTEAHVETDA
jgi:tRNA pseudouridine32 synthase/23S rRNA pseudouridine746 synthase